MLKKVEKDFRRKQEDQPGADYVAPPVTPSLEALLPDALALACEKQGVKKANQPLSTQFMLGILGGAFVALGGMFAMITAAGAEGMMAYGLTRLLMGITFSLGLLLVVLAGAQLFTSDCLMVMGWASGRLGLGRMLRVWSTVWLGNFVGGIAIALLLFFAGNYLSGKGEVGATALYFASYKASLPVGKAFFMGILCNVLVSLAAYLALAGRTLTDKVLAIMFPISAFIAAGFEHCVANMFFIPYGLLIKFGASEAFWATEAGQRVAALNIPLDQFAVNMAAVTFGNWVGGGLLVGAFYWLIYSRPRQKLAGSK
ncbi:MAG: formate/nitrite transporter family protein [Propionivibrio sp.]